MRRAPRLSLPESHVSVPSLGAPAPLETSAAERELVQFVSFVLDDLQDTWARPLPAASPPGSCSSAPCSAGGA